MNYELIYTNAQGLEIAFRAQDRGNIFVAPDKPAQHEAGGYKLILFEGFGEVAAEHQMTKAPYQDGESHIGTTLKPRYPYLKFIMTANSWESLSALRKHANRVFDPKLSGTFEISYGDKRYALKALPEALPYFADEDAAGKTQKASINFKAPDPYWQSVTESETEIVTWIGGLTFPLQFPTAFSTAGEKRINVINAGDVETPIRVEISAPATNPTLTHVGTGEFIRVKRELTGNDVLVVTTDFGNKRVEIDGVSKFNYIDQETTFFSLLPGDNILEYTSDDEQEKARVRISYKNRYLGV